MHESRIAGALTLVFTLIAAPAAAAPPAFPGETPDGRSRCAVKELSTAEQEAVEAQLAAMEWSADALQPAERVIPTYFHVITTSTGGANVSGRVPAQLQVLNDAYASAGFQFDLRGVQVVANDAWFYSEQGSAEEFAMKVALRVGGPETLNVYTTNGDVYLGWATYPIYYPRIQAYDGVVLYWATLPGSGFEFPYDPAVEPDGFITYDRGDTATHEVGHWLGLPHTFAGGCSEPGDFSKDTPAEAEPQFFCAARDSCTGKKWPGTDPIHNFMDYVDDVCMDHFTADQEHRMQKQWKAFRRD